MTPHPRLYLSFALVGTILFAVLAILVATDSPIVHFDRWNSERFYAFTIDRPFVHAAARTVTDLGWSRTLAWFGAASVIVLMVRRERFRALAWAAGLSACLPALPFLKEQFQRPRPPFADITGFSFPSGHAFGSAVVYGLFGLLVLRVWHPSRWRWLWAGLVWAVIPLIGLSRIMLGVHYFSDVLAGTALGLGWAFWCAAVADWWDRRRIMTNTPAAAPPGPPGSFGTGART